MSAEEVTGEIVERRLWDRRPEESEPAWHAFCLYRDMEPPRSTRRAAEQLNKSHTLIGRWSGEYAWMMRTAAYDSYLDQQAQLEVVAQAKRRAAFHAQALDAAIMSLAAPALAVAEKLSQGKLKLDDDVEPAVALSLVERTAKLLPQLVQASRLVHGESTENLAVQAQERRARMSAADADEALLRLESGAAEGTAAAPEATDGAEEGERASDDA